MTINFPARRSGTHFRGTPLEADDRRTLTRRSLFKLGAGSAAVAAAGAYGIDKTMTTRGARAVVDTAADRPVKELTLVGTDGWISMPAAAAGGTAWPDAFAPAGRDVYMFGFAPGGQFETPNRLGWANEWNGAPGTHAEAIGGLSALKNRANLSAPILYYHEGDDIRVTLWNGGMTNRPDIVDAHTIHWHGFPNQVPYFDGVPNDSLSVPIGANLVYRYLPYRGMAGTYMYHCHVSDAEHVQMGLQGVVFIRAYQNYGFPGNSPFVSNGKDIVTARAINLGAAPGPLGYVFNDGIGFAYNGPEHYYDKYGSTAYDREFAFILDEIDPRIHSDDAHFQDQDFSQYAPRFGIMNGRAWPDTKAGNWDVTVSDPDPARVNQFPTSGHQGTPFLYNIATTDQVLLDPTKPVSKANLDPAAFVTGDLRLGQQPWSSLIQANAGETIVLRFSNLGYAEHSMELAGLPFRLIGMDAKNLLTNRDGYEENPRPVTELPSAASPMTFHRADISSLTYRTSINVAESRDILVQIPNDCYNSDGTPVIFDFFDREDLFSKNATAGGPLVGGMRTQLHVFPSPNNPDATVASYALPAQRYPQQVFVNKKKLS